MIFDKDDLKHTMLISGMLLPKKKNDNKTTFELIASENVVSKAVMAAQGSSLDEINTLKAPRPPLLWWN